MSMDALDKSPRMAALATIEPQLTEAIELLKVAVNEVDAAEHSDSLTMGQRDDHWDRLIRQVKTVAGLRERVRIILGLRPPPPTPRLTEIKHPATHIGVAHILKVPDSEETVGLYPCRDGKTRLVLTDPIYGEQGVNLESDVLESLADEIKSRLADLEYWHVGRP